MIYEDGKKKKKKSGGVIVASGTVASSYKILSHSFQKWSQSVTKWLQLWYLQFYYYSEFAGF